MTSVVVSVLAASAVASFAMVHRQFHNKLYGPSGWAGVLGVQDLNPEPAQSIPPEVTLTLVGDALAFYYQRPMTRLRYRTVFVVPPGDDVVEAWRGGGTRKTEWLLVDPVELRRFANTYWGIPPVPADWAGRSEPLLLPPNEKR